MWWVILRIISFAPRFTDFTVEVTTHHEDLLVQAAGVTELEGSLAAVRGGLSELDASLDKYDA